jgi:hypothetical protein
MGYKQKSKSELKIESLIREDQKADERVNEILDESSSSSDASEE